VQGVLSRARKEVATHMNYFLGKTEPAEDYSIDDLARDGETLWDQVHNYQAIGFIKSMQVGDKMFIYHSGKDKAIVGLAEVCSEPFENKDDPRFSWAVRVKFIQKYNKTITLKEIKAEPLMADFLLVRNPRLSVMPVSVQQAKWLRERLT
jgi:predicted RNA-binding protein with PUA-like domain